MIHFRLFLLLLILLLPLLSSGQVIINKIYSGQTFYIENPVTKDHTCCCVSDIFVNDNLLLTDIDEEGIELVLDKVIGPGEELTIKITHKDSCRPIVKEYPAPLSCFPIKIEDEKLEFEVKADAIGNVYTLEIFEDNNWKIIKRIKSKSKGRYRFRIDSHIKKSKAIRLGLFSVDGRKLYQKIK